MSIGTLPALPFVGNSENRFPNDSTKTAVTATTGAVTAKRREIHLLGMKTTATQTIALATRNADNGATMQSSAQLCLDDARSLFAKGDFGSANSRAIASLSYSVGILHQDWTTAKNLLIG